MRFHANYVSTSISGDYCQALFAESQDTTDPDTPYLLIQRQFEMPDDGECNVETHIDEDTGHIHLRRGDFRQNGISIEIDRSNNKNIHVTFVITTAEFEEALPILKIISGEMDPYAD